MENQNERSDTSQGGDLSDLKKMFSNYQRQQKSAKSTKSREDLLSKYFMPKKSKEIFRILPPKKGKKYIEEAFFHVVPTNIKGGKKKFGTVIYCPARWTLTLGIRRRPRHVSRPVLTAETPPP